MATARDLFRDITYNTIEVPVGENEFTPILDDFLKTFPDFEQLTPDKLEGWAKSSQAVQNVDLLKQSESVYLIGDVLNEVNSSMQNGNGNGVDINVVGKCTEI